MAGHGILCRMNEACIGILIVSALLSGCGREEREVVVYCALDRHFAEPILKDYEDQAGVRVRANYDVEANKTVGLFRRLLEERSNPRCDVFWNNETIHTILLKREGILSPYRSPSANGIPAEHKDPEGYWTGFAARARVIVYNSSLIAEQESAPQSVLDLAGPAWRGKCALAKPLFGTTATHAAILFTLLGRTEAEQFFRRVRDSEVGILAGNAMVRDRVAAGEYAWGITDTDDVHSGMLDGKPLGMVFPDQQGFGAILIPNSLSLISGSPHPEEGMRLIDFLLDPDVEKRLAAGRSAQIPLRPGVETPPAFGDLAGIQFARVDFEQVAEMMDISRDFLRDEFLR